MAHLQPRFEYHLVDVGALGVEDLPVANRAAVLFGLERCAGVEELPGRLAELSAMLAESGDAELRRAFAAWLGGVHLARFGEEGMSFLSRWEEERTMLAEKVKEWTEEWLRQGREEGIEQGLAHERELLRRLTASRFGTQTAERLRGILDGIRDPERLAEVGEWIVGCKTGAELLARVTHNG